MGMSHEFICSNEGRREKVFNLINEEREYQDNMPQHANKEQQRATSVAAWIIYMQKLLDKAGDKIYDMDERGALEYIRKCAAVGVACMEYNNTPHRTKPALEEC